MDCNDHCILHQKAEANLFEIHQKTKARLERMTTAVREVWEAQARYRVSGEGYPLQLMKAIDALVATLEEP